MPIGVAHQWRYETVRPGLLESGELISAEEAQRRVMILKNPGLSGSLRIKNSVAAGLQC